MIYLDYSATIPIDKKVTNKIINEVRKIQNVI